MRWSLGGSVRLWRLRARGADDAVPAQFRDGNPIKDLPVVELLIEDGQDGWDLDVYDRVAVVASIATISHVREVGLLCVLTVAFEAPTRKDRTGSGWVGAVVEVADPDDTASRIYNVSARRN